MSWYYWLFKLNKKQNLEKKLAQLISDSIEP